jgi:hypothetical protein
MVPLAKVGNSKTPSGPFQRMVFDAKITSLKFSNDFGPASSPCQPSGICFTSTT